MRSVQVAVVGAGPAGIAAAIAAARSGADTLLIDEQVAIGGNLRWRLDDVAFPPADLSARPGAHLARDLAAWVNQGIENLDTSLGTVAWGLFEENVLGLSTEESGEQVRAGKIVLATGSTDAVHPFPGWTLPGVMTGRAVQIFMHIHRVLPARQWVVVGDTSDADRLADDITQAGGQVMRRWDDYATLEASGEIGVERVTCGGEPVEADGVAMAIGRQPDPELAFQTRVLAGFDWTLGGHVPLLDADLRTSNPDIFVCGDAAGVCEPAEAIAEGWLAGLIAAGAGEADIAEAREQRDRVVNEARQVAMAELRPARIDWDDVE